MADSRYYYSVDGTDVQGPAEMNEIQGLIHGGVLRRQSQLCAEGETQWQPIAAAFFNAAARPTGAPAPRSRTNDESRERSFLPGNRRWSDRDWAMTAVSAVMVLGTVGYLVTKMPLSPAGSSGAYLIGAMTGCVTVIIALPFLISGFFKRRHRILVRMVGIICVAALLIGNRTRESAALARVKAVADQVSGSMKAKAQAEIKAHGYYAESVQEAEGNLQKLKAGVGQDNTETSRIARDLLGVDEQVMDGVKTSTAAEKACRFDLTTVRDQNDLQSCRPPLIKLRDTQTAMITYLQHFDDHCREALASESLNGPQIDSVVAGMHKSGHIDVLILIWQLKVKLTDDYLARLDLLDQKWGAWAIRDKKLVFMDTPTLNSYNGYVIKLHDDVRQIGEAQKQVFQ